MSYLGFARKYRPKNFEEVVGQQHTATTLQNAIKTNRLHHAYLFCGSRGVGKTSMARIFAKALNCSTGPTIKPCNTCELCLRIASGEDVDVIEIDGASNRGIEEIRNIKDNIKYMPSRARYKIFIIDEIHMLTMAAFNALLKILEEPPAHAKFIFATTQLHSIPDTVLSRCQRFVFKKISLEDIVQRLQYIAEQENISITKENIQKIAHRAGGALRDAEVLLEQLASFGADTINDDVITQIAGDATEEACKIIDAIVEQNPHKLLTIVKNFSQVGGDISYLLTTLAQQFRDIMVLTITQEKSDFIEGSDNYCCWLENKKGCFDAQYLQIAIHSLIDAKNLIHRSLMGRIILETVLLKIYQMSSLVSLKAIESKLINLETHLVSKAKGYISVPLHGHAPPSEVPKSVMLGLPETTPQKVEIDNRKQEPRVRSQEPRAKSQEARGKKEKSKRPADYKPTTNEEKWNYFIECVGEQFKQIASFLRSKAKYTLSQTQLIITIPREHHFLANMMSTQKNKIVINELIVKCFGKSYTIKFIFEGDTNHLQHKEMREAAENDLLVHKAVEMFGGRIINIKKTKS